MSGSGGNTFSGGFDTSADTCDSLFIDTFLSSPKEDVIAKIMVGTTLDVGILTISGMAVVGVLFQGQMAGGLASPKVQRLRECIEQGTDYLAEVIQINDGQVRVHVAARRL